MTLRVMKTKLYEWRRTPSAWVIAGLASVAPLVGLVVIFIVFGVNGPDEIRGQLSWISAAGTIMVLFGVVQAAGEYRHRTIVPLALAEPRRIPAVTGQLLAYALAGALVGLAAGLVVLAVTAIWLAVNGTPFDAGAGAVVVAILGGTLYTVLATVLGAGLGMLVRNQVAATIAVLVYVQVVDPNLAMAVPSYGQFGPTALGTAMSGSPPQPGGPGQQLLAWPVATALWTAAALLLALAGWLATRRRELA
jgi:ABC-2 type transport system permease protein